MSSNNLTLPLKTKWFDMWKSGKKTFDYREIKPYWAKRFCRNFDSLCFYSPDATCSKCDFFKPFLFRKLILTKGYPKRNDKQRVIEKDYPDIFIEIGNESLGSDPNKYYFVITAI